MREAKVEYDDIADMHWWMVDHIHYLPAMIYAVLLIDIVSIVVIIKHSKVSIITVNNKNISTTVGKNTTWFINLR